MDKINLKEILNRVYDKEYRSSYKTEYSEQCILEAMKEACQEILRLAAENATLSYADGRYCLPDYAVENFNAVVDDLDNAHFIDKQSILDTINQIE